MKLWYQVVANFDKRPGYKKSITEYVNSVADPGTVVECYSTPTGLGGEEYNSIRYFDVAWLLTNALTAERTGYDAFIIGNTLDAGIQEARELVNIPVVGHLHTSLFLMSTMAKNFSMIASHKKFASQWERMVASYGFKERLVSIDSLDLEVTQYEQLYSDKQFEDVRIEKILDLAKKAVAAGAEIIFIVPGSMYLRLAQRGITEIDGAPIFNSIPAVIKMAELMVKYRQITGLFVSRKLTYALPPKELVQDLIARHKLEVGAKP